MSTATPEPVPQPPHNAVVKFAGLQGDTQVFLASRPDVLLVLKSAEVMTWGWLVQFEGTLEELIAVGVASADMFEDLGKSGQTTGWDPNANKYVVKKRKNGRFWLELWMLPEGFDPSDPRVQAMAWWRDHGAEVDAEVAKALKRMRRPRREAVRS